MSRLVVDPYVKQRTADQPILLCLQTKLSSLDSATLARLMQCFAQLRYEPDSTFMRAYYSEVYHQLPLFDDRDLATALGAFSLMRKLMKHDFLQEFLDEVLEKLPTFGCQALGNVMLSLGLLLYTPQPAWTDKIAAHVKTNMWKFSGASLAAALWGLARAEYQASTAFVEELIGCSTTKLRLLAAQDFVNLLQALELFGYAPQKGSSQYMKWCKWFETFTYAADKRSYTSKQVRYSTSFIGRWHMMCASTSWFLTCCLLACMCLSSIYNALMY